MTAPYVAYTATAGQDEFVVPFPYINRSHVVAKVNGVVREIAAWPSPTILKAAPAVAGGGFVEIYRTTPLDGPLVAFQNGAVLTAEDLNTAVLQLLYRMQESANLYERTVGAATQRLAQLGGVAVPSADVFDTLAQQLLESTLFNELLDRIKQIELGGGSALLQQEIADRIAAINAVYADIDAKIAALAATQDDKFALVNSRITTVEGVNSAQATQLNTVIAQANSNQAAIASEATARANADSATASLISLIGAKNAAGTAFIIDANTAQISPGTSLSSRLTGLQSSISSNTAAITSEATTRASADSALSTRIDSVQATANNAAAAVTTEQNARIAGDNALANSISTLTTTVNNNAAAISSEASTRASADSAMAGQINVLTTSVNGNTASITSLQGTVNGVMAQYSVRLNVNGHVTGFIQNNNGTTGDFTVVADKFAIIDPNGGSPFVPFQVSGGVVYIKEAAIQTLNVGKLGSGTLNATITQNADWNVGTGRIIWDNGAFMKVSGVGFGTSNQFIEWFGPKMAISSCSEANAIQYLKTNGDAYFGGSLSGGVLRNSGQTSDIGSGATITVGPFGSNGGVIQVVTSYSAISSQTSNYDGTNAGRTDWDNAVAAWGATSSGGMVDASKAISCNVVVQITRNGSAFGTLTITGGQESIVGQRPVPAASEPGYLTFTRTVSGSITGTDNAGGTTNRTFVATLTTRTDAVLGTIDQQRIGIICTEQ